MISPPSLKRVKSMSVSSRFHAIFRRVRAFLSNRDANVAIMFGLSLIPLVIAAGTGVDLTRAMIVKSSMTEALDAAALAVASTNGLSQTAANTLAQNYFNANYKMDPSFGVPGPINVTINGQSATVTTTIPMPTVLMSVAGIHTVAVNSSSTVVWGQSKLWVSLVLDNTGSMTETDATGTSKIDALKTATHNLLTMLQNASANAGDVQVAIVPFSKTVNVGTNSVNAAWIDWTNWDAPPPGNAPDSSVGPGSTCPWSNGVDGFRCTTGSTNGASTTNTIPASGLICPSVHKTSAIDGQGGHYYNGCYDSVASGTPTKTSTVTSRASTPVTDRYTCTTVNGGPASCVLTKTTTGTTTTTSDPPVITDGYTGDSVTVLSTTSTSGSPVDGSQNCKNGTCTFTRKIVTTTVVTTATATGVTVYTHTWHANSHSTWGGCIMDRNQDDDTKNTTPDSTSTSFPAENAQSCVPSVLATLSTDWTSLGNQVDAMTAGGTTNQTIGLAWGWQAMTQGDPLNAPMLPNNTSRFIVLVSDGLNTQDRFSGDGSNEDTTTDNRMAQACNNAKAAGIVIYAVFVDLNGTQGNSTVLQNCASDPNKYFDLKTSGAIITTLNQIGQQITNVRVSQ